MEVTDNMRDGIIAAGSWIIDHVKMIDTYPSQDSLTNIRGEFLSNGGSPYNLLKNLAILGAPFSLKAIGLIGDDEYGRRIRKDCEQHGIDCSGLNVITSAPTAYTDVMVVGSTGRRTFFHQRGVNAFLDVHDFDFSACRAAIFHLGYLLLLDTLDKVYEDGSSGASRVLKSACASGLKTSVDLVSEDGDRFKRVIQPSLPYINYLFLNEFEAARLTDTDLTGDPPDGDELNKAATELLKLGVRDWVFIHFPQGVFAKCTDGRVLVRGALDLPGDKVVSALGAGDALASGILYSIHEGLDIEEALKAGVCCAAACLHGQCSSDGMTSLENCLELGKIYKYKQLVWNNKVNPQVFV